jgi:hypothetical protein
MMFPKVDSNTDPSSDVLQSHDHAKLSSEEIAKAVARHNKAHNRGPKVEQGKNPQAGQKKSGKPAAK